MKNVLRCIATQYMIARYALKFTVHKFTHNSDVITPGPPERVHLNAAPLPSQDGRRTSITGSNSVDALKSLSKSSSLVLFFTGASKFVTPH